jgi:hypothetical protein
VKPLMHLLLSLPPYYLHKFWVEYYLALLRLVEIGDFRSPEMICGDRNALAKEWVIS